MDISAEALRALLNGHMGPQTGAMTLSQAEPEGGEQRFVARDGHAALDIHLYPASEREAARREEAGLTLGSAVGLAPALAYAGAAGPGYEPGAWLIIAQQPRGEPLGRRPLSDAEVDGWLFLLLTLHHLRPDMAAQPSSMSADLSAWWARNQPAWETCRASYAGPATQPLLRGLTQLHAITQVRIETNRGLWAGVERRPCHGDPSPGRLVKDGARLTLTEWGGFGLGDPAIEVARVAALAALADELSSAQYSHFIAAYLAGMRDLRDTTLEERLRLFASVAPMGVTLAALAALAQPGAVQPRARRGLLAQVARALIWSQEALGVQIGAPAALLAPLG
jgi:thiamine kinase-like enzyme